VYRRRRMVKSNPAKSDPHPRTLVTPALVGAPITLSGCSLISKLGAEAEPAQQHALHVDCADLGASDEEGREDDSDDAPLYPPADVELWPREADVESDGGEVKHRRGSRRGKSGSDER
jgi:hypothetical protein